MKILQILPELKLAGAQIMAEGLIDELILKGHEVEVVSLYSFDTPLSNRMEKKKIKVHFLNKRKGLDFKAFFLIRRIIREFKPDIIHTHTYALKYAYIASRFLYKGKIVHTIHNMASKETTESNRKLERKLFKKKIVQPVAISPIVKNSIVEYYGEKPEDVPMIYNGIKLDNCIPKIDYNFNDDEIRLIHIGRFQEQKNHELMLKAMRIVTNTNKRVRLHCFGAGILEDEIKNMADSEGVSDYIIFEGTTDNQYNELHKADIFLLPSKWEGMPITLIEAMGTGLPVVVTPVGGIPDMVSDQYSGIICELTVEGLSQAIKMFLCDKELREQCGNHAREEAQLFSAIQMANSYEEIYVICKENKSGAEL